MSDIENNPMTTENDRVAADEPSNLHACAECTAPYPPDVPNCPHCGTPNAALADEPAETQQPEDERVDEPRQRRGRLRGTDTVQLPEQNESE